MSRLGPALFSLAIVLASSCAPVRDDDLGAITLLLGGEGALSADGRALLPVFVRSVDGEGRAHPTGMLVTTSLGDVLDPDVGDTAGPRVLLRGDAALFFLRCPLGGEGDAHVVVERPDGVSAEIFASCVPPLTPRLELEASECAGSESYEGEMCPLRARVTLVGHSGTFPALAAPVIFRVSTQALEGPVPLEASLVIAGGQPTNEVTVRTDASGYAEVKLLPPALFTPYEVTLSAFAITSAGVVDSGPVTLTFPFTDLSSLSVTADNTITVNPQTVLDVHVSASSMDNASAATLTATVSRTGASLIPTAGESVTFALDVTSADVARLDGDTATVVKATDDEGRASVIVTAAGADSVGAAVVRVIAVVDGLAFEELVVVDITDSP